MSTAWQLTSEIQHTRNRIVTSGISRWKFDLKNSKTLTSEPRQYIDVESEDSLSCLVTNLLWFFFYLACRCLATANKIQRIWLVSSSSPLRRYKYQLQPVTITDLCVDVLPAVAAQEGGGVDWTDPLPGGTQCQCECAPVHQSPVDSRQ